MDGEPENPFEHRQLVKYTDGFFIYRWEKDKPATIEFPIVSEIQPVQIHVIPKGSDTEKPSFLMVFETVVGTHVIAEIDLERIWPAIESGIREIQV